LKLSRFLTILFLLVCGAARSRAQTTPDAPAEQSVSPGADSTADAPTAQTVQTTTNPPPKAPATQKTGRASNEHNFWDKENDWLFAGVAAARTLDYFSTLNMRRRGRQEILLTDAVVDDHPAFAVIEAATTGASIGLSYAFHYYGHHKLETLDFCGAYRSRYHRIGPKLLAKDLSLSNRSVARPPHRRVFSFQQQADKIF
jgi:hypothetical protein